MMKFSAPSREEIIAGLVTDEEIGFDDEIHRGQWEDDLPQGVGIRNYPNGQVTVTKSSDSFNVSTSRSMSETFKLDKDKAMES
jgi:hypothetical protein